VIVVILYWTERNK